MAEERCKKCGFTVENSDWFCSNCGKVDWGSSIGSPILFTAFIVGAILWIPNEGLLKLIRWGLVIFGVIGIMVTIDQIVKSIKINVSIKKGEHLPVTQNVESTDSTVDIHKVESGAGELELNTSSEIQEDRTIEEMDQEDLIKLLGNNDIDIREKVAMRLGEIGNSLSVEPLIKVLRDKEKVDSRHLIRRDVIIALGKIGDPRAIEPLIEAFWDKYPYIRNIAAESLGGFGIAAVKPLTNALKTNDNFSRQSTTYALGLIAYKNQEIQSEIICILINVLVDSASMDQKSEYSIPRSSDIENTALEALEKVYEATMSWLGNSLQSEDIQRQNLALTALLSIGGNDLVIDPLVNLLENPDDDIRAAAAYALSRIKSFSNEKESIAFESLIHALKDDNERVISNAAAALTNLGNKQAIDSLIKALYGEGDDIRLGPLKALGELGIGVDRVVEEVKKLIGHNMMDVKKIAIQAIGNVGGLPEIDYLMDIRGTLSSEIHSNIETAISKIKNRTPIVISLNGNSLDDYVDGLINARKGVTVTSFFLGTLQPPNLKSIGREVAESYGIQGLEYITQQIKIKLKSSHPYDGRELESAWQDIWYEYKQ